MAIQLNDRDYLIFKLLAEHNVLLEKHIAWFISQEEKPVLIRDRLRKLFYLDYLLCERYDEKLPWWTTPTKPLIYKLAPLAKAVSGNKNSESEESADPNIQKYLEMANMRMIFLIAQTEGILNHLEWKTQFDAQSNEQSIDSIISCSIGASAYKIGLLCHPLAEENLAAKIETVAQNIDLLMIIAKDEQHRESLQKLWIGSKSSRVIFAIHQDLYKNGLSNGKCLDVSGERANIFNAVAGTSLTGVNSVFTDVHAA